MECDPKVIHESRVVEYLGLPGVGKTWQTGPEGFCARAAAVPRPVPPGMDATKRSNTAWGLLHHPRLCLLLLWSCALNWKSLSLRFSLRPPFVVLERIGRINRLLRERRQLVSIHIDEGALQFVWRTFSQMPLTKRNIDLLASCLAALPKPSGYSVAYMSCADDQHMHQIRMRGKPSQFDLAVIEGDEAQYRLGRSWMAAVLLGARRLGFEIQYVRTLRDSSRARQRVEYP